jgi:site-specific DNA recombinase
VYGNIRKGLEEINEKHLERSAKRESTAAFIKELEQSKGVITEFDEGLWNSTIEKVLVNMEDKITFVFKDGM